MTTYSCSKINSIASQKSSLWIAASGSKKPIAVIALSNVPWNKPSCHPLSPVRLRLRPINLRQNAFPRTDISNSPWHFRHRCSSRLAPKGCDGWVGFPDDRLLLRWQPRTGCFRGSQSVRTIAATASYPTLSRSCFAIPSCVTDCWSGAPTVPPSGPQSNAQGTHEPFNGTTRNDRLVAKPTNIQIVELGAHLTASATVTFDPPHRFRHHHTPDATLYHFLFCAPNADTATLSGRANLLLESLHPDQSPTPADLAQAAGRLMTFITLIKRTFTTPALRQVYNHCGLAAAPSFAKNSVALLLNCNSQLSTIFVILTLCNQPPANF